MDFRNVRFPAPPRLPTHAGTVIVVAPTPAGVPAWRDSTVLPPPLHGSRPLGLARSRAVALAICGTLALVLAMTVAVAKGSHGEGDRLATAHQAGAAR